MSEMEMNIELKIEEKHFCVVCKVVVRRQNHMGIAMMKKCKRDNKRGFRGAT